MERFLTRYNVALTQQEALRLARLDGTRYQEIAYASDVELIHISRSRSTLCNWAWWSDSRLTTASGLPDWLTPHQLSPDASKLITLSLEGNPQRNPTCPWQVLANIERIINITPIAIDQNPNRYKQRTISFITSKHCQNNKLIELLAIHGHQQEMPFCQIYKVTEQTLQELLVEARAVSIDTLLEKIQQLFNTYSSTMSERPTVTANNLAVS